VFYDLDDNHLEGEDARRWDRLLDLCAHLDQAVWGGSIDRSQFTQWGTWQMKGFIKRNIRRLMRRERRRG